jgi:membrane associated rhomboid family serine protease
VGAWIGEQALLAVITQALGLASIAFWAHVGGFVTGAALGLAFVLVVPKKLRRSRWHAKFWYKQHRFNKEKEDDTIVQLKL